MGKDISYGYGGSILRIDLSNRSGSRERITDELKKRFLGGLGINDWLLWQHFLNTDINCDPRSEDNVLIAGLGPFGGTALGLGSKMKFTFKSPLTNMFGDSAAGGTLGPNMRWAGYDNLVVTGKAEKPVYILIDDKKVEIRDATHLWGKGTEETQEHIFAEIGDPSVGIACIGPAGENLVGYACITVTHERAAGRTGGGCVMGSKNLKAIVARGTRGIPVYDPKAFLQIAAEMRKFINEPARRGFKKAGTIGVARLYKEIGDLTYRNGLLDSMPSDKLDMLMPDWVIKNLKLYDYSCSPGCSVGCCNIISVKGDESPHAGRLAGTYCVAPELYALGKFGVGCDVGDFPAITYMNNLCNRYGLDGLEVSSIIPWLMELWERGVITEKETEEWCGEPVRLEWGNVDAMETVIRSMGEQDNELGRILKDGILPAAERIMMITDKPTLPYATYGKGGMAYLKEVRPFPSWAAMLAVSSRGADHLKGLNMVEKGQRKDIAMAWFGKPEAAKAYDPEMKGMTHARAENNVAAINALGICVFLPSFEPLKISFDLFASAYHALTGIELTGDELYGIGERCSNLEKAFNSRLGLTREDDKLCERYMKEPVTSGPGKGMKCEDYFDHLLDQYYDYKGWDKKTSLQTRKKLEELGLSEVADVLEKDKALV